MRLDKKKVSQLVDSNFGQQMLREGDRAQAGNPASEQVWMLLVDEIDPDPKQPRRHFDQAALNDLATDIAQRGVLQPILVRPIGKRYQIIVGERRWRATKLAGKPRIPCLLREMDDDSVQQAQLVENIVRADISDIERGIALRRLYETAKKKDRKITWETVAQMVGLSRMRIHHLYNLSMLPLPIIEMIESKRLSGSHGVELARLEKQPELQEQLAQEAARPDDQSTFGLSVAQLRTRINELQGSVAPPPAALSPKQIEKHSRDIIGALRPDLPEKVQVQLRQTAEQILKYLDEEIVKSTLQK
jgi:ParB/RepB/Spo0J family partition protein